MGRGKVGDGEGEGPREGGGGGRGMFSPKLTVAFPEVLFQL